MSVQMWDSLVDVGFHVGLSTSYSLVVTTAGLSSLKLSFSSGLRSSLHLAGTEQECVSSALKLAAHISI